MIDVDTRLDFIELSPRAADDENAAAIPYGYVDDESLRVALYRKLAEIATATELATLRQELIDRFGPAPATVERLLKVAQLRIVCNEKEIRGVDVRNGKVVLSRLGDYLTQDTLFPRLQGTSADEHLGEVLALVETVDEWAD